jgi:hypothetical protein
VSSLYGGVPDSNRYFVQLKDGTKINGNPKVVISGQEFQISKVHSLKNKEGFFRNSQAEGVFKSENLVKRTTSGKINLYSDYVTNYHNVPGGHGYTSIHYAEVYFSKGDGPVLEINYNNLLKNLSDNDKSMEYLKSYKNLNYVKICLTIVGLGIVVAGISRMGQDSGLSSSAKSTIVTGAIVTNLAWIPYTIQGNKLDKAIAVYNKNRR